MKAKLNFKEKTFKDFRLMKGSNLAAFSNDVTSCHSQLLLARGWKMRFYAEDLPGAKIRV